MKTAFRFLLSASILFASLAANGQAIAPASLLYNWPAVINTSSTGQVGQYLILNGVTAQRPANYTVDWSVSGTAPSACTFRVEGSTDATNWYGLDATAPAATSCTSSNMESIAQRPVLYVRINLVTFTPGDSTTKVVFHYTGGRP